jgi:4-amino-4-deoxy-L-arabinose transferase-like glycosyltransferase
MAFVWLAWVAVVTAATAKLFRWHLDYFSSPGPQYHRIALFAIPGLAILSWLYSAARKRGLWRYETAALANLIVLTCLRYEPRAFVVTAVLFLACYGIGNLALRKSGLEQTNPLDRIATGFGAGAGLLMSTLFIAGLLRLLYTAFFVSILGVALIVAYSEVKRFFSDLRALQSAWQSSKDLAHPVTGIAMAFAFVAAVCGLMLVLAPSIAFDSVATHLPSVQYYAGAHALEPVPGIVYSYFPQAFELLWTLAYALAGEAGAQMIPALFFVIFLLILFRLARLCGLNAASAVTAVIAAATLPFLHWTGSVMKNDLAVALFESLALLAFLNWLERRDFRWIVAGAFFAAQAFGVKYVALFAVPPIALLYGYAVWTEQRRWRAIAIVLAIFIASSIGWPLRAYLLTGNPVEPAHLYDASSGSVEVLEKPRTATAPKWFQIPWNVLYPGLRSFESPLPAPAGILLIAFAPLGILGWRLRPKTPQQIACLVFAALYFLYWAWILAKVRYAILPYALSMLPLAAWMSWFYDRSATAARLALAGLLTYCLLISTMALMIVGINGPQFSYFAGRLDKPGYLRQAMQAYGAVEFLHHTGNPHARVFGIENLARAYAPDPYRFSAMWCTRRISCAADRVVKETRESGAEYLIVIERGVVPKEALERLGSPERVYRDPYFSVYHLSR